MKNIWEKVYRKGRLFKWEPHSEVGEIEKLFTEKKVKRILDLGCGGGRHTVYLASKGFDTYGSDYSAKGLMHTLSVLRKKGLTAHLTLHDMTTLPFDDQCFDAVISIQVIHHNKLEDIHKTIQEITRVLKEGGFIWITMPISKHEPSKKQKTIEPDTVVPLNGHEKGVPHHYFKMDGILSLFPGFSVITLHIDQKNYLSLVAEKVLR